MKIFVGFGYNPNDEWIKELVIPLIQAFGVVVVTGEDIHGDIISQAVTDRIKKCDGLFAFFTKRDQLANGSFTTHPWVMDELTTAVTNGIPAVKILESSVAISGGLTGDRQFIPYEPDKKAELLVTLAGILGKWKMSRDTRSIVLLPDDIMHEARPHIRTGSLKCIYQFRDGNEESQKFETFPFRLPDSLGVDIKNIPSQNALIQMSIEGPGFSWSCGYQPFNQFPLKLQKD